MIAWVAEEKAKRYKIDFYIFSSSLENENLGIARSTFTMEQKSCGDDIKDDFVVGKKLCHELQFIKHISVMLYELGIMKDCDVKVGELFVSVVARILKL